VVIAIIGILVAMLLPAVQAAREATVRFFGRTNGCADRATAPTMAVNSWQQEMKPQRPT
jgi:hypothetical protein